MGTLDATDYNALPDDEFRREVRSFFESRYPEALRYLPRRVRMREIRDWWNTLYEKGWIAPNWPREWGGMGLDAGKMVIFLEEMERHGVARAADQGITQVGPILMRYGTGAQKEFTMNYFIQKAKEFARNEEGVTAIEYGLLAALVAVVIIAAVSSIGDSLNTTFESVATKLSAPAP